MTEKTVPMKYRRMEFNAQLQTENDRLRAQRDALLEALKAAPSMEHTLPTGSCSCGQCEFVRMRRAAIKAVEENT